MSNLSPSIESGRSIPRLASFPNPAMRLDLPGLVGRWLAASMAQKVRDEVVLGPSPVSMLLPPPSQLVRLEPVTPCRRRSPSPMPSQLARLESSLPPRLELLHFSMKSFLKQREMGSHTPGGPLTARQKLTVSLGQALLSHPAMAKSSLGSSKSLGSLLDPWRQFPKTVRSPRHATVPRSFSVPPTP